jgi:hypothetical protein
MEIILLATVARPIPAGHLASHFRGTLDTTILVVTPSQVGIECDQ